MNRVIRFLGVFSALIGLFCGLPTESARANESVFQTFKKTCARSPKELMSTAHDLKASGWAAVKAQSNKQLLAVTRNDIESAKSFGIKIQRTRQIFLTKNSSLYIILSYFDVKEFGLFTCYIYEFGGIPDRLPEKVAAWLGQQGAKTQLLEGRVDQYIWRSPDKLPEYSNVKIVRVQNDPSILLAGGWTGYSISTSARLR